MKNCSPLLLMYQGWFLLLCPLFALYVWVILHWIQYIVTIAISTWIESFFTFYCSLCSKVYFSSVAQSCPTLCNPMDGRMPGLPVHHQLLEFTQTHVHCVGDAIRPSHPLSSPSPPAPNPSQHQGLFQWVSFSHQVTKVLEFQLQHQFFQWILRTDFL